MNPTYRPRMQLASSRPDFSAPASRGLSILLVEDEQSIAEPFASALARSGFRTTVAGSGGEALGLMRELHPDVVLLDLALPDIDGRDVCRLLRRESDVPIIMVTASGTVTDRVVGLELGADDYVVKPFATTEIVARIRAVLRRGQTDRTQKDELTVRELRLDLPARRAWLAERELELTRKEFDLLARLARDAGRVVTRESLMSDVWDMNWFGSTKTLDVHVTWLRRKLGDDPASPTYIHTVRGVGFRLVEPQEPSRKPSGPPARRSGVCAAAGDGRSWRPARGQSKCARERGGAYPGAGPGGPGRGDGV
jgi:two-component system, OmpR family, response regulator RegX3